jgi:AraC family transcriptional regulator
LTRAREVLHDGFRRGMTVDDLAREADVHPAHLAREFRRHVGASPADYRRRLQLDWVAERLVHSDAPIAALAAQAGFFDQSHLTHRFRRVYGTTPAEYRRTRVKQADGV